MTCPYCHTDLNSYLNQATQEIGIRRPPPAEPGDYSFCATCRGLSVLDPDGRWREVQINEWLALEEPEQQYLVRGAVDIAANLGGPAFIILSNGRRVVVH
jgi:hypothetical protein